MSALGFPATAAGGSDSNSRRQTLPRTSNAWWRLARTPLVTETAASSWPIPTAAGSAQPSLAADVSRQAPSRCANHARDDVANGSRTVTAASARANWLDPERGPSHGLPLRSTVRTIGRAVGHGASGLAASNDRSVRIYDASARLLPDPASLGRDRVVVRPASDYRRRRFSTLPRSGASRCPKSNRI
jgi:hypothetical protein